MALTKTQEKARKSFDYQCNKASKCRHEKYQVSCMSCPEKEGCEICEAVKLAQSKM